MKRFMTRLPGGGATALLACAALLGLAPPALADYCLDCIGITAEDRVHRQRGPVSVRIDVDAARVGTQVADAYIAALQPDSRTLMLRSLPGWEVEDLDGQRVQLEPFEEGGVGEYRLYFVLAEPGSDPFDMRRWLSAASADIVLLPEGWTPPDPPLVLRNGAGLPRVVTLGGGEIHGQPISNSRQALDAAYDAGQRFFVLHFSWTADRHLVLAHDWERNFHRLFPSGQDVPTKREFDAMGMAFGLDQLNLDELVVWLRSHPGARVVADVREDNLSGLYYIAARAGDMLQRFIPQIHAAREYERARDLGFENLILSLARADMGERELLDFLRGKDLLAVSLPLRRALETETAALLKEQGVFVYAHSVNEPALLGLLQERGVSGIYSDRLLPAP